MKTMKRSYRQWRAAVIWATGAQVRRGRATLSSEQRGEIRHSLESSRCRAGDELTMRTIQSHIGESGGRCVCSVCAMPRPPLQKESEKEGAPRFEEVIERWREGRQCGSGRLQVESMVDICCERSE